MDMEAKVSSNLCGVWKSFDFLNYLPWKVELQRNCFAGENFDTVFRLFG